MTFLRGWLYRRASITVQTLLMALLVMNLFLTPLIGISIQWVATNHPAWLYWFPGYWFSGLYEYLRPATHNLPLRELGVFASRALGWWRRYSCSFPPGLSWTRAPRLETTPPAAAGPGRLRAAFDRLLRRTLLRHPVEYAVFHFISQTITRSLKHRLFLATYGGFGAAYEVITFATGASWRSSAGEAGLLILPLTLSFILVSGLRAAFNFPAELRPTGPSRSARPPVWSRIFRHRKWLLVCAIVPCFC